MDAQTASLITELANGLSLVGLLLILNYRLAVALGKLEKEKTDALNRYIDHLERHHAVSSNEPQ